jgi:hypothetical protein
MELANDVEIYGLFSNGLREDGKHFRFFLCLWFPHEFLRLFLSFPIVKAEKKWNFFGIVHMNYIHPCYPKMPTFAGEKTKREKFYEFLEREIQGFA